MGVVNLQVDSFTPSDDAQQDDGVISLTAGGFGWIVNDVDDWMGFRLANVQLPQGCTIDSAPFTVALGQGLVTPNYANFQFWAEAADTAGAFGLAATDISARTKTSASFTWTNLAGYTQSTQPEFYQIGDAATLIQEVVNRPGWVAGNAIVIFGNALGGALAGQSARIQMSDTRLTGWPWGVKIDCTWASAAPPVTAESFNSASIVVANREIIRNVTAFS